MRRAETHWQETEARELLAQAETLHLATTRPDGTPVLRALHAVLVDDLLAFHGAKAGERRMCLGRPAVASAEKILANIPSYFVDPERACPATTYYESAQAHGNLVEVTDLEVKARVIAALMRKYQPEGGYQAIDSANPLYTKALRGLLVFGVKIESVTGKRQYGQKRSDEELRRILDGLWARGTRQDLHALERIRALRPEEAYPRLAHGDGLRLHGQLEGANHERDVSALLAGSYWNRDSPESIVRAHRSSAAWVGCSTGGKVIATARAVSDGSRHALILDVIVSEEYRGQGVGRALMQLLLAHPELRDCGSIRLVTRDARAFYEEFGFEQIGAHVPTGYDEMLLRRKAPVRDGNPA